jgi:hypothetical protein
MWETKKREHRRLKEDLLLRNGYETTTGWRLIMLGLQLAEKRQPSVFVNNALICNHHLRRGYHNRGRIKTHSIRPRLLQQHIVHRA